MKTQLTSLDIHHLIDEIKDAVIDAILRKVYQTTDMLILQLYRPGHGTLELVLSGRFVALLNYRIPKPSKPTNFAMLLRKHLKGKRVVNFYQHGFDRIVVVEFEEYLLICEILPRANVMLVGKNDERLWSAMIKKNLQYRKLKIHRKYEFPEPPLNPKELKVDVLLDEMKNAGEEKIVSFLAQRLSLGGRYAEEVCLISGVNKDRLCGTIKLEDAEKLLDACLSLMNPESRSPRIIMENDAMLDVVPLKLRIYEGLKSIKYGSFNEAVNDYFVSILKKEIVEKENRQKSRYSLLERLEHRLEQQMNALELYKKKEASMREAGNKIYENYSALSELMEKIKHMKPEEIAHLKDVVKVDGKKKEVVVKLGGVEVTLNPEKSLNECAAMHYEEAKRIKKKLERLIEEIEVTKKRIAEAKKREQEVRQEVESTVITKKKKEKKRWYEKFRWFMTSNNTLVVCGRDATTNELLIKKHLEKKDLVLHADFPGSPFALMKNSRENEDLNEIKEAAQFVACYSRAWKEGVGSLNVYYVYPEQVSKKAPAGEYLKKGAFMIYGRKNWLKVEMRLAAVIKDSQIHIVPALSLKPGEKSVIITPGRMKARELAENIISGLVKLASKEEREILKNLKVEDVMSMLPAGGGAISKR